MGGPGSGRKKGSGGKSSRSMLAKAGYNRSSPKAEKAVKDLKLAQRRQAAQERKFKVK